jgi:hypothetical protein
MSFATATDADATKSSQARPVTTTGALILTNRLVLLSVYM